MRSQFYILAIISLLTACNTNRTTVIESKSTDTLNQMKLINSTNTIQPEQVKKRLSFKDMSELVKKDFYSTWVNLHDGNASLALHFQYKDTLAISYSAECWLMYPYKLDKDKIVVYWDKNIDTKYDFDIVKAINKTDKRWIGKPFMQLELINDTTLKATYLMRDLIRIINASSNKRTFFPDEYMIAQDGYL